MAAASNFVASCGRQLRIGAAPVTGRDSCSSSFDAPNPIARVGFSGRRQGRIQFDQLGKFGMNNNNSRKKLSQYMHCLCTDDTVLVNQRVPRESSKSKPTTGLLAYELVQGNLVQWNSFMDKSVPDPPTCVLLHGILGSRKNWGSFSKRLAQEFPLWQFLLVDLRCHGDSASRKKSGPHTISSAALDVLKLVGQLRLTPRVLVGHSFGGKVALSMVEQAAKPLARPVRVWVLDATPGKVRAGGDGEDHPGELISFLRNMPEQVSSKQEVVDSLVQQGFSLEVARWVVTNLRRNAPQNFSWTFDLNGIADMYQSYEKTNLWEIVENVPRGVHINFLKAERSLHRWALEDLQRIHAAEEVASDEGAGVQMHVLEDAGHWVHADNPDGLFRILSSTFRMETTLRGIRGGS